MDDREESELRIVDRLPTGDSRQELGLRLLSKCALDSEDRLLCHLRGEFALLPKILPGNLPQIQTSFFERDFELLDGDMLVISGFVSAEQIQDSTRAVPSLRSLPVLGELFRANRLESQIYLMVTPNRMK